MRAALFVGCHRQGAAVGAHDFRTNIEAQSESLAIAGGGLAPKRLANFVDTFRRDGLTGIPNVEDEIRVLGTGRYFHRSLRRAVLQRIADQVRSDLLDSPQIAAHLAGHADVGNYLTLRLAVLKLSDHGNQAGVHIVDLPDLN